MRYRIIAKNQGMNIKEESTMKKMLYSGLAVLVFACFTTPAWAQKGGHGQGAGKVSATHAKSSSHPSMSAGRSNKGGAWDRAG